MILMPIRLDFETRKVQKYVKCKEIDVWGGQNHVLCYFIRNMGFRWPILHQSWVQISYDGLENNLNDSHFKKAWFWHQKGAKIRQIQGNLSLRGRIFAPSWCQNQTFLTWESFKLFSEQSELICTQDWCNIGHLSPIFLMK